MRDNAAMRKRPTPAPDRTRIHRRSVLTRCRTSAAARGLDGGDVSCGARIRPSSPSHCRPSAAQFHDMSNLSWVVTAYLLSATAVAPVFGTLSDIFGRRVMIMIALGIFVVGSVLCALAPNLLTLILARFLQGIGGGGIIPVVPDHHCGRDQPEGARRVSGLFQQRLARRRAERSAARRRHHRLSALVADFLDQPAADGDRARVSCCRACTCCRYIIGGARSTGSAAALLMASAVVILLVLTWGGVRYPWSSPLISR